MKRRAAAYCRVSTEKEDQLNSLAAQREYFRIHAEENGYDLVRIYADEGITGTKKRNRKEFQRMLEDAEKGMFSVLFVKDVSRFARNTVDSLESVRLLKDNGVDIVFVNNRGILETSSELMFTIMSAMAQEESVNMSKRVKFGKAQNARKGRVPNLIYGYDKTPGEYFTLKINEEEAEVVRRVFRMYLEEGSGCLAIANILNAEGKRTQRGSCWSQNAVSRLLKNEIYIGKVVNGKETTKEIYSSKREKRPPEEWITVEKPELRIVSDEEYYKAQLILGARYDDFRIRKERQSSRHLFSTLIKCGCCHRSFRRIDRRLKNSRYVRWVCSSRNGDGAGACANAVKIREDQLLEEIIRYFEQRIGDRDALAGEIKRRYAAETGTGDRALQPVRAELTRCRNRLDRLRNLYVNGMLDMDRLKEQSAPVEKRIQELEQRSFCAERTIRSEQETERRIDDMVREIRTVLNADNLTNAMLKQVIDKIEVDENGNIDVFIKKAAG